VNVQLNTQKLKEQEQNQNALRVMMQAVRYLAQQGLSMRGHVDDNGNFIQLLQLLASNNADLQAYLASGSRRKFLSHENQNDILKMMNHAVLRQIIAKVNAVKFFSIIADETTDMSRMQQLSICLRWIDDEFCVHEDYVGMHEVEKADAASLTAILLDVIVRLGLDVKNLRGQG
jgi:Domain of unknown function (DUF4371)